MATRNDLIRELQNLSDINERKGVRLFYRVLHSQYSSISAYIRANGIDAALAVMDTLIDTKGMTATMIRYYQITGISFAKWQYRMLREEDIEKSIGSDIKESFGRWLQGILEYIYTDVGRKINNINETTRSRIVGSLIDAKEQGLGARAAAKLVDIENETINRKRALLIARTEATRAASQGAKAASDQWKKETGKRRFKQWVSIIDKGTREDHEEADGQIQPDNLLFEVGAVGMEYPGDEGAPAIEVCNCRCKVIYMSERMAQKLGKI